MLALHYFGGPLKMYLCWVLQGCKVWVCVGFVKYQCGRYIYCLLVKLLWGVEICDGGFAFDVYSRVHW